jgi:hypothetical protein
VRLEGLGQLKNPMTSLEIEPVTLQLVVNSSLNTICENVLLKRDVISEGISSAI